MSSLPTITNQAQMLQYLQIWRQQLNPVVSSPPKLRSPFNFRASSPVGTVGIQLQWEPVPGADGYIIEFSSTGDFSGANTLVAIHSGTQTSYFDNIGTASVKRWYRIQTTSGTASQPQSVEGNTSAPINATTGSGSTTYDGTSGTTGGDGWNKPLKSGRSVF
jgi:hypothetical protein